MTAIGLQELNQRYVRLTDRSRSQWTFYQYLQGLFKHLFNSHVPNRDRLSEPLQRLAATGGRPRALGDGPHRPNDLHTEHEARRAGPQAPGGRRADPPVPAPEVLRPAPQSGREGPPGHHQVLPGRQPGYRGHAGQAGHPLYPAGGDPARGTRQPGSGAPRDRAPRPAAPPVSPRTRRPPNRRWRSCFTPWPT